jgi:hypothetical protein
MRTTSKWMSKGAAAGALALLLATPTFAQSRGGWNRNDPNGAPQGRTVQTDLRDTRGTGRDNGAYRQNNGQDNRNQGNGNQDHGYQGRNQNNGYQGNRQDNRDQGYRNQDNRYQDNRSQDRYQSSRYNDGYVRGVVDRVDPRGGTVWLRDQATGRYVAAELGGGYGYGHGQRGLRRGDYVELSGRWSRGGVFAVIRIDNVRNGRY